MKLHTLTVKRKPVSKGLFRRLSAVTRSRKQRVAATANPDDLHDDHSSKISRALTIIFLIHIVVIGLIFFHRRYLDGGSSKAETTAKKSPAANVSPARTLPKLSNGDRIYRVEAGDNYARIAAAQDVGEKELREANNNVDIVSGLIMKIPPKRIIALPPPEVTAITGSSASSREHGLVEALPVNGKTGTPKAQAVVRNTPAAASASVSTAAPSASGKTYVVQSGDNIWRIANKHKVDQKALMKLNNISDPKKLKLGMSLNIPR